MLLLLLPLLGEAARNFNADLRESDEGLVNGCICRAGGLWGHSLMLLLRPGTAIFELLVAMVRMLLLLEPKLLFMGMSRTMESIFIQSPRLLFGVKNTSIQTPSIFNLRTNLASRVLIFLLASIECCGSCRREQQKIIKDNTAANKA